MTFFPPLHRYLDERAGDAHTISAGRRAVLESWAEKMAEVRRSRRRIRLNFICTHNSRRSQFGQVWAWAASRYYGMRFVDSFSGGTEVTACHPNTLVALERAGIAIQRGEGENAHHLARLKARGVALELFSKVYEDEPNPKSEFMALMTCGHAEENCPFVAGANARISLNYDDPKISDGTSEQTATYDERSRQIAAEMMYAFHHLNGLLQN